MTSKTPSTPTIEEQLEQAKLRFVRRSFFVVVLQSSAQARTPAVLLAHLDWLKEQEARGTLLLSGLRFAENGPPVDGLTVLRVADFSAAQALMETDPAVGAGSSYTLHRWDVAAGNLPLTVRLSDASVELDPA